MRRVLAPPGALAGVFAALVLTAGGGAFAAGPVSVSASVSSNLIGPEDTVTLTVTVSGGSLPRQISAPDLPPMTNLRQGSGASTSSSFRWVNGETSATRSFTWALLPLQEGRAEIPPIEVRVGEALYRTQAIVLQVSASAAPAPPSEPGPGPGRMPGGRSQRGGPSVQLRAVASNTHPWAGEPFVLTLKLLVTRAAVAQVSPDQMPSLQGFLAEDDPVEPASTRRHIVEDGIGWDEYTLVRKILTATQPGARTIGAAEFRITARGEEDFGDPFSRFFGNSFREIARRTDPITIDVRPLPEAGRPAEFSGAVGQFTLRTEADRLEAVTGEAVGVKVTVEGTGDLRASGAPAIGPLADFRTWEPKLEEKTSFDAGERRVRRTWNHVLVPLAPGRQEIPAVRFAWFDPKEGVYRTAESKPVVLTVRRNEGGEGPAQTPVVGQKEIRAMRQELHALKASDGPLRAAGLPLYRTSAWWVLLAVPLVAPAAAFAWTTMRSGGARARERRRRARAASERRLRAAEALLRHPPAGAATGAFYDELAAAVLENIAERWGVSAAGLSYGRLEDGLASLGVSGVAARRALAALETFDGARFSPASGGDQNRRRHLDEARAVVHALEREAGTVEDAATPHVGSGGARA